MDTLRLKQPISFRCPNCASLGKSQSADVPYCFKQTHTSQFAIFQGCLYWHALVVFIVLISISVEVIIISKWHTHIWYMHMIYAYVCVCLRVCIPHTWFTDAKLYGNFLLRCGGKNHLTPTHYSSVYKYALERSFNKTSQKSFIKSNAVSYSAVNIGSVRGLGHILHCNCIYVIICTNLIRNFWVDILFIQQAIQVPFDCLCISYYKYISL